MNIASLAPDLASNSLDCNNSLEARNDPAAVSKAAEQFEGILLRQILTESMKPLLENGPGAQVYGYFLTASLAESIGRAGGLGLGHVLQTQLTEGKHE